MSIQPPTETSDQIAVAVLGATGATGTFLVEHLLSNAKISKVVIFVRRTNLFATHPNAIDKLIEIQFGQDDEHSFASVVQDMWPQQQPIHSAISCLGTTAKQAGSYQKFIAVDLTMNDEFFTSAHNHGVVNAQLMSSVGAKSDSGNLYLGTKGKLEDRVKDIGFQTLIIYQPGILDNTTRPNQPSRPGESCALCVMKWMCCCFLPNCFSSWRPMDVHELAYLMVSNIGQAHGDNGFKLYNGSQEILNAIKECKKKEEQSIN